MRVFVWREEESERTTLRRGNSPAAADHNAMGTLDAEAQAECDRLLGSTRGASNAEGREMDGRDGLGASSRDADLAPGQVDPRVHEVAHNLLLGSLAVHALQPLLVQSARVPPASRFTRRMGHLRRPQRSA